ncbi:MAG: Dna[CI] antecedent, DciA [Candidatus Atribacteria bacterium]|jgi:hypothetical protein|uniref:DciA family protein n=1 Tax=Atrimonas thermophila TaxID=3064161 RepID=UPI0024AB7356|nr:Dna[CI] antecedent, DciA [Candidatus Atribacteria bacterium]
MPDEEGTTRFFCKEPVLIGNILEEVLEKQGLSGKVAIYRAVGSFQDLFPEIASFCEALRFVEGTLYIRVAEPTRVLEVRGREEEIKEKFKKEGIVVDRLKIFCG